MNKQRCFVLIILLVAVQDVRCDVSPEHDIELQSKSCAADFDQVDELLKDGQECGMIDEREPVEIKPISNSEYLLRVIGGAIVLKYIAAKNCAVSLWQRLFSRKN